MNEEVFYYYVRGHGWVPRLEPLDNYQSMLDELDREIQSRVFETLMTLPLVPSMPYQNDHVDALEYTMRYVLNSPIQVNSAAWMLAIE